jgi:hypothetical protein
MKMANTWILIRHPDKEGDKEGLYLGNTAKITEQGKKEMRLVVARLRLIVPEAVTCSMFPRTKILAEHLSEELGIPGPVQTNLLNEFDKPQFLVGMKRSDPLHQEVTRSSRELFDDDLLPISLRGHISQGEVLRTRSGIERDIGRLFQFVESFRPDPNLPPPETLLSVTHAKLIAGIFHYLYTGGSLVGYYRMADEVLKISTTGITILVREPSRRNPEKSLWKVATVNEESHTTIGFDEELRSLISAVP